MKPTATPTTAPTAAPADAPKPFQKRLKKSLADPNVAAGILDFQQRWRKNRDEAIQILEEETGKNFKELTKDLAAIKASARSSEKPLQDFIQNAENAGAKVIYAKDAQTACQEITEILKAREVNLVVKSKSMLTEEIFLNSHLENNGIEAVETDLGQWILQIDNDHPSHLVIPAIHKRRFQIAELYQKVLNRSFDPEDIETLARVIRPELRQHFLNAGAGITGGNVLVAETGSIGIITNEGNANLTHSLSNIHIAVVGVDKLVNTLDDAFQLLRLLSKSATGQIFTTYLSFLTGARKSNDERGNIANTATRENEQFIILVDNGRTAMSQDVDFESALGCIRCGACANVCPPYQVVGGHAFGHIYTGAIGLVNTAFHHSAEVASGPAGLCVSCGACATVCPVDIPLPKQILLTRNRIGGKPDSLLASRKIKLGLFVWSRPKLFRLTLGLAKRLAFISRLAPAKYNIKKFGIKSQSSARKQISASSFGSSAAQTQAQTPDNAQTKAQAQTHIQVQKQVKTQYKTEVSGKRVALFMQCVADQVAPEIVLATAKLIAAAGAEVVVPPGQHCCGLPALDVGDHKAGQKMAQATLEQLTKQLTKQSTKLPAEQSASNQSSISQINIGQVNMGQVDIGQEDKGQANGDQVPPDTVDLIVTPATSCAITISNEYEELTGRRLEVLDIVEFLSGPGKLPDGCLAKPDDVSQIVTAHQFCQRSSLERSSPGNVPANTSGNVPANTSGNASINAPEHTPDDTPDHTPDNSSSNSSATSQNNPISQNDRTSQNNPISQNDRTGLDKLILQLTGKAPEPLNEAEFCCGFGGWTSMVNFDLSNVILSRKMNNLDKTNAEIWITDNPGCVLHLRGGAKTTKRNVKVLHIAEYLASRL